MPTTSAASPSSGRRPRTRATKQSLPRRKAKRPSSAVQVLNLQASLNFIESIGSRYEHIRNIKCSLLLRMLLGYLHGIARVYSVLHSSTAVMHTIHAALPLCFQNNAYTTRFESGQSLHADHTCSFSTSVLKMLAHPVTPHPPPIVTCFHKSAGFHARRGPTRSFNGLFKKR